MFEAEIRSAMESTTRATERRKVRLFQLILASAAHGLPGNVVQVWA